MKRNRIRRWRRWFLGEGGELHRQVYYAWRDYPLGMQMSLLVGFNAGCFLVGVVTHSRNAGCRRSLVGNVWGWRTPLPSELWMGLDDGLYTPEMDAANLDALTMIAAQADVHVVAFGVAPGRMYPDQVRRALDAFALGPLYCLATSDDGWPLHPLARGKLAIPNDVQLVPWSPPAV